MRRRFIKWATDHAKRITPIVTFAGEDLFTRYEFFRRDEWPDSWWDEHRNHHPKRPNALPWWLPFNMFLHRWDLKDGVAESFHDHPRWSITICLSGQIIERTPWCERLLGPGSVAIRSRKAIHAFKAPDGYSGETWTLFIVGRRKHRQNSYVITPR